MIGSGLESAKPYCKNVHHAHLLLAADGFYTEAKNVLYARVPAGATPVRWCEGESVVVACFVFFVLRPVL
jgi:hypothetical protein